MNLTPLLTNWKTTSAGLVMIAGSIVHLVFSLMAHTANENTWTIAITAIIGGIGLLVAGDASQSQPIVKIPPDVPAQPQGTK